MGVNMFDVFYERASPFYDIYPFFSTMNGLFLILDLLISNLFIFFEIFEYC